MAAPSFKVTDVSNAVRTAFTVDTRNTIATAATATMVDAANLFKNEGRANITGAGFSRKWANAWRTQAFPKGRTSINAAAFGWHKIPYSLIFETGGTIFGKNGRLWAPLKTTPKDGRKRATVKSFINRGIKLFVLKRAGKSPLLAATVRVSAAQDTNTFKPSMAKLKKGATAKRGKLKAVPLFIGFNQVTLRKRFNISGVAQRVASRLATIYDGKVKA